MSAPDRAAVAPVLGPEELGRYDRHLALPEVGIAGQESLRAARVLVVGAGGLGSPAAYYLAAAGVGALGLVDFDAVEASNLQRQILYAQSDVGRLKVEAAAERLTAFNPYLAVETHPTRLDSGNALDLVGRYDLVIDGTDNFATRYRLNDACVRAGRPMIYGSIFRFEGQVAIFGDARRRRRVGAAGVAERGGGVEPQPEPEPDPGPCYRCLFPDPPPPGLVPSCAEGGVLGVLPGVIGSLQATEAIKWIVGAGEPLIGRLVVFDALRLRVREVRVPRDPACAVCSPEARRRPAATAAGGLGLDLDIPEATCAPPEPPAGRDALPSAGGDVAPATLAAWLAEGRAVEILDVRTPGEWAIARLPGARLVPLHELPSRIDELDPARGAGRPIVVLCHLGVRSAMAADWLRSRGVEGVWNLLGGIDAWSVEVDRGVARY